MCTSILQRANHEQKPISKEQQLRACESSLWVALFNAQQAGVSDLVDQIARLHADAGRRRRLLEA